jgi:hypothetical protein
MHRWPAGTSVRRVALAIIWLLLGQLGLAPAATAAAPTILGSTALWSWTTETTAQVLQAAEASRESGAGKTAALNRGIGRGYALLRGAGPDWLGQLDLDLQVRED